MQISSIQNISFIYILSLTAPITLLVLRVIYMQENYRNKNKMFVVYAYLLYLHKNAPKRNVWTKNKIKTSDGMLIKNWSFQTFKYDGCA